MGVQDPKLLDHSQLLFPGTLARSRNWSWAAQASASVCVRCLFLRMQLNRLCHNVGSLHCVCVLLIESFCQVTIVYTFRLEHLNLIPLSTWQTTVLKSLFEYHAFFICKNEYKCQVLGSAWKSSDWPSNMLKKKVHKMEIINFSYLKNNEQLSLKF